MIVDFYEQVGYLPGAILNYLLLLGWSYDDKREFFTRDEMIADFSLERVTQAPASFDPKKLWAFQDHYMGQVPLEQKIDLVLPYLARAGLIAEPVAANVLAKIGQIVAATGDRLKVAGDILAYADFFFKDTIDYDTAALEKNLGKPGAAALLAKFRTRLATVEPFDVPTLEKAMHDFIAAEGVKVGDLIHSLRIAVTGKPVGPGLYDCLAILGREKCLERIDSVLKDRPT